MSNHRIECQLDLIINLLETLPDRTVFEFDRAEKAKRKKYIDQKHLFKQMEELKEK